MLYVSRLTRKKKKEIEKIIFICSYKNSCIDNKESAVWLVYGNLL